MKRLVCARHASTHDGLDVRVFFHPAPKAIAPRPICRGCLASLAALGMDWRPDLRVDPERAYKGREDRRPAFRARWIGAAAKDLAVWR